MIPLVSQVACLQLQGDQTNLNFHIKPISTNTLLVNLLKFPRHIIDKSLCKEHKPSRDDIKDVKGTKTQEQKNWEKLKKINKNKGNQKNCKFCYQDKQTDPKKT
jgi:hypothetical protein